jgi:hypothetical protein
LSIAAPSDTFTKSQMAALITEAQSDCNLVNYAEQFYNGNPALAKGIAAQHRLALARYRKNKELPLEINLGRPRCCF